MSDQTIRAPQTVTRQARARGGDEEAYLEVKDLHVQFPTADGMVQAVQGLSYALPLRRTLAIVGESGSGKSVSSMAVMGLHDARTTRISGSITVGGRQIVGMGEKELEAYRGADAAMIFQDPQSSLHPYFTVGDQIMESYRAHHKVSKRAAKERAMEMLDRVGIPNPRRRVDNYPHEFSGGMRQRAMIAMALVNDPKLLIADEPTTALDVTVQAQILDLIADLQRDFGSAVVFITHDLGVVAEIADDILVMYAGNAIEYGPVEKILGTPLHPYTWGLLESIPALAGDPQPLHPIPGTPPSLLAVPSGCPFHPRCEFRERVPDDLCRTLHPQLVPRTADMGRASRCHLKDPDRVFATEVLPRLP
jgi:peptide/nickel transport system ATP-binding protein